MSDPSNTRGTTFPHLPCSIDTRNIRLLELLPGRQPDPICCRISIANLESPEAYETVSYVWGFDPPDCSITVDGIFVAVRQNLRDCLCHLRLENNPRLLWVDALCINQSDDREKSCQVALMPEIYRSAWRTLIWLGKDEEMTDDDDRFSSKNPSYLSNGLLLLEKLSSLSTSDHLRFSYADLLNSLCLYRIMSLPWWTRVWVVQEAVVSQRAVLLLGFAQLPWEVAMKGAISFTYHSTECCRKDSAKWSEELHTYHEALDFAAWTLLSFQYLRSTHANQLLSRLWMMRTKQATDPRDRIYAALGLLTSSSCTDLEPDYSMDVGSLYRSVVLDNITSTSRLDILMGSRQPSMDLLLPSWVIDWRRAQWTGEETNRILSELSRQVYHASLDREPDVSFDKSTDELQVSGIIVDTISQLGNMGRGGYEHDDRILQMKILNSWRVLMRRACDISEDFVGQSTLDEVFWRTILADVFLAEGERLTACNVQHTDLGSSIRRITVEDKVVWEHWWAWRNGKIALDATPEGVQVAAVRNIGSSVTRATAGRKFFITNKGFFGLGPATTQVDDEIAILLGGSTPFILREQPQRESNSGISTNSEHVAHILLGDCFVHGFMDGEVLNWAAAETGVHDITLR